MKTKLTLLTVLLVLSTNISAVIVNGTCGDNLTWELNTQDRTLTISGSGKMTNYDSYRSNAPWFQYSSYIAFVSLPNGLVSIGNEAFYGCISLTSITIPNSVTIIGERAFYNCSSLTSVTIPNSVTSIGWGAFWGCSSLTSVTIPNSVTSIGESAFSGCISLTSVTIPNSVTSIGNYAFYQCSSLTSITIPNSVTSIGHEAFRGCSGLTSVTIPNSVTSIGDRAFEDCSSLTSVTIPNSVTSIGGSAFYGCGSLTSITIPNSVKSIGSWAFSYCSSLTSITIPNSVTSIGDWAFRDCSSLTTIYNYAEIPQNIGSDVFNGVGKSTCTLYVPDNSIELYQIADVWKDFINIKPISDIEEPEYPIYSGTCGDNLTWQLNTQDSTLTISGSGEMTSSPWYQYSSYIAFVSLPEGLTSIGEYAFYRCGSLTSVTIPNSVKSIGSSAFYKCSSLTSINIPNSVTSIGNWAFYGCSSLTSITIPNSVTSIGDYAFGGCDSLITIIVEKGNTVYDSRNNCNAIIETVTNTLITGCRNTIIPNSVTNIGNYAFRECSSLTSVTIPNSVISIGEDAFHNCSNLTSINIPNSVILIGNYAFRECSNLTNVTIGNSVTSIGDGVFRDCSSLTTIYNYAKMPQNIGSGVFYNVDISTCTLYVPANSVNLYKNTNIWKDFNIKPISEIEEPEYTEKDYNVYYENEAGDIISQETLTFTIPAAPKIDGFTFLKWVVEEGDLDNGIYIQAVYTANTPTYTPDEVINPTNTTQKLIRNGNVYILHNNHTYHISGAIVK